MAVAFECTEEEGFFMNQAKCPPPGETARTTLSENEVGQHVSEAESNGVFRLLERLVEESGVSFVLHEHSVVRTVADAMDTLQFDLSRFLKTVAFRVRGGRVVLAALRGDRKVNYPLLAALLGVNRRELAALSPEEVRELLHVEPGGVSPLPSGENVSVLLDEEALSIAPTVYCGIGRPDRTLEIAPADLLTLSGARIGRFSR
jgi:Cys-tRNA(Pro)/Cys-tRNA(Cys) deacylase